MSARPKRKPTPNPSTSTVDLLDRILQIIHALTIEGREQAEPTSLSAVPRVVFPNAPGYLIMVELLGSGTIHQILAAFNTLLAEGCIEAVELHNAHDYLASYKLPDGRIVSATEHAGEDWFFQWRVDGEIVHIEDVARRGLRLSNALTDRLYRTAYVLMPRGADRLAVKPKRRGVPLTTNQVAEKLSEELGGLGVRRVPAWCKKHDVAAYARQQWEATFDTKAPSGSGQCRLYEAGELTAAICEVKTRLEEAEEQIRKQEQARQRAKPSIKDRT